jgi:hypothetical protein
LLLSVGQVTQTEALLDSLTDVASPDTRSRRLAAALRLVIAAVKLRAQPSTLAPCPTTVVIEPQPLWLRNGWPTLRAPIRVPIVCCLGGGADVCQPVTAIRVGWTRVAELEFSHGRIKPALRALEKSLELAPRNAQALALKDSCSARKIEFAKPPAFRASHRHRWRTGQCLVGPRLCRIRRGHAEEGGSTCRSRPPSNRNAACCEAIWKAFSKTGYTRRAETELELARLLDAGDPTPWLYSALLRQRDNRINESVHDLEESQRLNDNRQVYRSQLLLDQDRAVRGANLATVYHDAGLADVSLREAARAVNADYANYSAHLFLADTYNQLRDIKQINLRYETAWFSEYLVANLLAPVGAGTLAQTVSQQEYSKLFEENGLGLTSSTEYFSDGEWIQNAVQHGTFGNSSYAAQFFYHSDTGDRPNNDLSQFTAVVNLKQQITSQDSVYARVSYYRSESGDVNQYYDQTNANRLLRTEEHYDPSVLAGYHREWSPGNHTLFLGGFLQNTYEVENPLQTTLFFNRGRVGEPIRGVAPLVYDQHYQSDLDLYTAEMQQLWQHGDHTVVLGGRFQAGQFDTPSANQWADHRRACCVSDPAEHRLGSDARDRLPLRAVANRTDDAADWRISYDWLEYRKITVTRRFPTANRPSIKSHPSSE